MKIKIPYPKSIPYSKDVIEIIVAFIAAWIFLQGLGFALGTQMPVVSVVSESMEPILHRGDLLVVIGPNDLKVGDIIIYNVHGIKYTIVHRIIKINPDGTYESKGDNNNGQAYYEHNIKKEQIIGKVVLASPLLGYPRLALYAFGI